MTLSDSRVNRGDRKAIAAGRFYSGSAEVLRSDLSSLFSKVSPRQEFQGIRAIISPHAGYVFSGIVAAAAYASVPPEKYFSNIFIIGSSHLATFNGASVFDEGDFITPLGRVMVNREIAAALKEESELFSYDTEAHDNEHSIEVQLPFIQYLFCRPPQIVPVLIGTGDLKIIETLAVKLKPWFTPDNLFIISTDFSHYPSYTDATAIDRLTADAILSGDRDELIATLQRFRKNKIKGLSTNMCGWSAGLILMHLTSGEKSIRYHHLLYRNSGDSEYGDKDGVVGYHSFVITDDSLKATGKDTTKVAFGNESTEMPEKTGSADETELPETEYVQDESEIEAFNFTDNDRETLFRIARASIETGLGGGAVSRFSNHKVSGRINRPGGVFVTLYLKGELRGCIGRIDSAAAISDNVAEMSFSAAFSDPRFPALTSDEYNDIEIEISVLSPLKRVYNKEEIIIGKHGVYMKKEGRSGVLLPQVATERGWCTEQFLQHTANYKAGIGKDGWRDAELSVFETLILKESPSLGTVNNKQ